MLRGHCKTLRCLSNQTGNNFKLFFNGLYSIYRSIHDKEDAEKQNNLTATKNISRLRDRHRFAVEGCMNPVTYEWEKEKRAMGERFGRYGMKSGVPLGELWPSLEDIEEYAVALHKPYSEVLERAQCAEQEARNATEQRLKIIPENEENYAKRLEKYKASLVKQKSIMNEKEKKLESKIREIQEHFGYWIDPEDPRFQDMFEKKEIERKKEERLAKRKTYQKKKFADVISSESNS